MAAYQLLHIHPYVDGNGRTARCLAWVLGSADNRAPVGTAIALALGLRKDRLGDAMRRVRDGELIPYFATLRSAIASWRATAVELGTPLEQALEGGFAHPALGRRAAYLGRRYVLAGHLTPADLKDMPGVTDALARKYWATLLDTGHWQLGKSGSAANHITLSSFESLRFELVREFLRRLDQS
jgi:hypothetical protein